MRGNLLSVCITNTITVKQIFFFFHVALHSQISYRANYLSVYILISWLDANDLVHLHFYTPASFVKHDRDIGRRIFARGPQWFLLHLRCPCLFLPNWCSQTQPPPVRGTEDAACMYLLAEPVFRPPHSGLKSKHGDRYGVTGAQPAFPRCIKNNKQQNPTRQTRSAKAYCHGSNRGRGRSSEES